MTHEFEGEILIIGGADRSIGSVPAVQTATRDERFRRGMGMFVDHPGNGGEREVECRVELMAEAGRHQLSRSAVLVGE